MYFSLAFLEITTTVVALEAMLQQIDQLNDIPDAIEFFQRLYDHSGHKMLAEVTSDLEKEGYMRVRKVNPKLLGIIQSQDFLVDDYSNSTPLH